MHILLVTTGPMPFDGYNRVYAMGIRTLHLLKLMLRRHHQVTLVSIEALLDQPPSPFNQFEKPNMLPLNQQNVAWLDTWFLDTPMQKLTYYSLPNQRLQEQKLLQQIAHNRQPDCVVAVGNYAAFLTTQITLSVPMWADLCGNYMSEAQAKAATYNDDSYLEYFLNMEKAILGFYDFFSTVSEAQKYATIGELGQNKRLNKFNYGQQLVCTIPISNEPSLLKPPDTRIIRGQSCPEEAFILIWSGGFNTWTDIDTLYNGVNLAMESRPEIHMVITGGQIDGHDEITFPRFRSLVEASAFKNRYHFAGWVENTELASYYYESDLGIILDKLSYEGLLGSRSRILEWANYEVPVISTVTSQLLQELATTGVIFTFEHGNSQELAGTLLKLMDDRATLEITAQRFRQFTQEIYSAEKVFQPLLDWINSPVRSYDAVYVDQFREKINTKDSTTSLSKSQETFVEDISLGNWAKHLQGEIERKEYQITTLWRKLQHEKVESEQLREWALSMEQQLLLHQSNNKHKY